MVCLKDTLEFMSVFFPRIEISYLPNKIPVIWDLPEWSRSSPQKWENFKKEILSTIFLLSAGSVLAVIREELEAPNIPLFFWISRDGEISYAIPESSVIYVTFWIPFARELKDVSEAERKIKEWLSRKKLEVLRTMFRDLVIPAFLLESSMIQFMGPREVIDFFEKKKNCSDSDLPFSEIPFLNKMFKKLWNEFWNGLIKAAKKDLEKNKEK